MSFAQVHSVTARPSRPAVLALLALVSALVAACGGGSSGLAEAAAAVTEDNTSQSKVAAGPTTSPSTTSASTTGTQATWTACASGGGTCTFSGTRTVRLGVSTTDRFVDATRTGSAWCDISSFPSDPAPGVAKSCWVSGGATSAPQTAAAATPSVPVSSSTVTTVSTAPTGSTSTTSTATSTPTPAPTTTSASSTGSGTRVATFTASGPITASSGQVISGLRISNPNGACITIPPGSTNVTVRDSDIGPCAGDASILVQGAGAVIEHNFVHEGRRGIYVTHTNNATVRANKVHGPFAGNSCGTSNPSHCSSAIQFDAVQTGEADGNEIRGSNYGSDALSMFESSGMRLVNNDIDVNIGWKDAAPFTMGDSTTGNPGRDNYVAGNKVRQQGGVPPGVFGSTANTILERNCLTSGIQAYNFSGVFNGVTVRNNVIGPGSFVPDTSVIAGWNTNITSTDCGLVP